MKLEKQISHAPKATAKASGTRLHQRVISCKSDVHPHISFMVPCARALTHHERKRAGCWRDTMRSIRRVADDRDAFHEAPLRVVVRARVVLHGAVVPECDRIWTPPKA